MAEIFPTEGLDLVLAIVPKTSPANTYIGLWGSQFTASTVGTAGNTRASYVEPSTSGTSYSRKSIAAGTWQATTTGTSGSSDQPGRRSTATQVVFDTAAAAWGTINGFFIADSSTAAAGALYFACNFDDTTSISPQTGDVVKVTPGWEIRN